MDLENELLRILGLPIPALLLIFTANLYST